LATYTVERCGKTDEMIDDRPLCKLHREPMDYNGKKSTWSCRVKKAERMDRARDRGFAIVDAEALRRGWACERCGAAYERRSRDFHWHHRDPEEKHKAVALLVAGADEPLIAELLKCDLLCRDCHHRNGLAHLKAENERLKKENERLRAELGRRLPSQRTRSLTARMHSS